MNTLFRNARIERVFASWRSAGFAAPLVLVAALALSPCVAQAHGDSVAGRQQPPRQAIPFKEGRVCMNTHGLIKPEQFAAKAVLMRSIDALAQTGQDGAEIIVAGTPENAFGDSAVVLTASISGVVRVPPNPCGWVAPDCDRNYQALKDRASAQYNKARTGARAAAAAIDKAVIPAAKVHADLLDCLASMQLQQQRHKHALRYVVVISPLMAPPTDLTYLRLKSVDVDWLFTTNGATPAQYFAWSSAWSRVFKTTGALDTAFIPFSEAGTVTFFGKS